MCVRMCIPNPSLNRGTPKRKPSDIYRNANRLQFSIYIHTHISPNLPLLQQGTVPPGTPRLTQLTVTLWLKGMRRQHLCIGAVSADITSQLGKTEQHTESRTEDEAEDFTCVTKHVASEILQRSI